MNKFSRLLSQENIELFHGVNSKMVLIPSETKAFYGPLSTSTSYHVGRTFATGKGMVLKINSYYPRLNLCKAFDASLISDYPEEQEWLVAFMYVRILEVRTRAVPLPSENKNDEDKNKMDTKNNKNNEDKNNDDEDEQIKDFASYTRSIYFAIHLFKEQIFSMSDNLEKMCKIFLV